MAKRGYEELQLFDCNQPCSENHLRMIAKNLTEWQMMAYFLGLSEAEIEEVDITYTALPEQRYNMLLNWKNKLKEGATYQTLIDAFTSMEKIDMAEMVRELSITHSHDIGAHDSVFAKHLKSWYTYRRNTDDIWPPIEGGKFCRLAMVKVERAEAEDTSNEVHHLQFMGMIGDATKKRIPIQLENIFNGNKANKKQVILIEGAPGSGKSMSLWHICEKWASGEWFQEFSLVIHVKLCDYNSQSPCSVADILPCGNEMKESAWREIMTVNGKGILFLFDGWDELSSSLQKNCIFKDIIQSSPKYPLLFSTVVVTSRFVSSDTLNHVATSHLEILGFTDQEIKECLEEIMNNEGGGDAGALMEEIESRPSLSSSCYLPLNAKIVAYVFLKNGKSLPSTMLEIFKLLILHCIHRHVKYRGQSDDNVEISSLDNLPKDLQISFYSLCKLAFNGLMEDRYVFTKVELVSIPVSMSLLREAKENTVTGSVMKYNFLHHTVQELLSAFHMSRLAPDEQLGHFKNVLGQVRFAGTIQFYAGITSLQNKEILSCLYYNIMKILSMKEIESSIIKKGLNTVVMNLLNLNNTEIADVVIQALKERGFFSEQHLLIAGVDAPLAASMTQLLSQVEPPPLLIGKEIILMANCLNEANDEELYKMDVPELLVVNIPLNPSDCLSLGHLIASSNVTGLGQSHSLATASIFGTSIDVHMVKILSEWLGFRNIKKLGLGMCNLGSEELSYITQSLKGNSIKYLNICICNIQVDESNGSLLTEFITCTPSLCTLSFHSNPFFGDIGAHCISFALQHNNTLQNLDLSLCGVTSAGAKSISDCLKANTGLKILHLSQNFIHDDGIYYLNESLVINKTLKQLHIKTCGLTEAGIKSLAVMLLKNETIVRIVLNEYELPFEEIKEKLRLKGLLTPSVKRRLFSVL